MSNSTAWIVRLHVLVSVKVCLNVCLSSTAEVVEELQGLRGTLVDDGPGSPGLQKRKHMSISQAQVRLPILLERWTKRNSFHHNVLLLFCMTAPVMLCFRHLPLLCFVACLASVYGMALSCSHAWNNCCAVPIPSGSLLAPKQSEAIGIRPLLTRFRDGRPMTRPILRSQLPVFVLAVRCGAQIVVGRTFSPGRLCFFALFVHPPLLPCSRPSSCPSCLAQPGSVCKCNTIVSSLMIVCADAGSTSPTIVIRSCHSTVGGPKWTKMSHCIHLGLANAKVQFRIRSL